MSIKISELPSASSVGSNDVIPIVQGGTTKQASISQATESKANHNNVAKDFWYGTQAEYDALATKDSTTIYMTDEDTTTPIATTINENSTNSEIAGAKAVYDNSLEVYSTTEQRVGTWIDGKPLYQKCFTGTLTSSERVVTIPESDISSDLDKICYLGGIVDKRGVSGHPIPYWKGSNDYANAFIAGNTKNILVEGGSQHGYGDFVLTVKYTKTTD